MRNKWMTLIIIIGLSVSFVGCQTGESTKEDVYEKFKEQVSKIDSYTCTAEVEVVGNKGKSNYTLKHYYKNPDNYKLEIISPENLKGKTMEYKGDKVLVKNPDIDDVIELPNDSKNQQYLFIGDFIKNYLQNDEILMNLSDSELVLEANIPGDSEYFSKQILYINKENKTPNKMEILDKEGNIRFTVKYDNFKYKK